MNAVRCGITGASRTGPSCIRPAIPADYQALLEISNGAAAQTAANFRNRSETLEEWIGRSIRNPMSFPCLVAEHDLRVVGFALASPFHDGCGFACVAELSVYVHPDRHGKGVGNALYGQLIPVLDVQGYQALVAMIALPNPASERLHERFGFRRCGGFTGVGWKFGRWHDISFWQRSLRTNDRPPMAIKPAMVAWEALRKPAS